MDMNFQYVKIDDESLEALRRLDLREPLRNEKVELNKWSVNADHTIALLRTGYVSSGIAQLDDNLCFWYFHLVANGVHDDFSISQQDYIVPLVKLGDIQISADFSKRFGLAPEELSRALYEAINVLGKGQLEDYKEEHRLQDLEEMKRISGMILQGKFSEMLQKCVESVIDLDDIGCTFRLMCLRHFKEHNVAVQKFSSFVLHDDADSFFIFDVVLWMYLHVNTDATINDFTRDYPLIANNGTTWRGNVNEGFYLGGSANFVFGKYLPQRIEQELIMVENDVLRFSKGHLEWLIQQLGNIKEPMQ